MIVWVVFGKHLATPDGKPILECIFDSQSKALDWANDQNNKYARKKRFQFHFWVEERKVH